MRESIFLNSSRWKQFFDFVRKSSSLHFQIKIDGVENGHFQDEIDSEKVKFKSNQDYSAPENLLGQRKSPASDMWSLGCILYQMIQQKKLILTKNDPKFKLTYKSKKAEAQLTSDSSRDPEFNIEFISSKDRKGARRMQQVLMIHAKVEPLPDSFWTCALAKKFWEHPVRRLIRNRRMLGDILSGLPRRFDGQKRSQSQDRIKAAVLGQNTVGMFVDSIKFLGSVFYRRVWDFEG